MTPECIFATRSRRTRFGEVQAFREGLYDLGKDVYAWMVPNGSWGESNAGLIVGHGTSLVVDTLWDPRYTRSMLDAMETIAGDATISRLVNTHADGDHFWGNQLLPRADSITSARALEEMDHHKPRSMIAFARLGRILSMMPGRKLRAAGRYFRAMCAPYDFASVTHAPAKRTFWGTLDLDVGGRAVRLFEVGPAHTQGDLIVHVPDAGVVFAGDILFIGVTPVMWAGPLGNWLRGLDLIDRLEANIIVPGHGPLTDASGVAQVRAYWEFLNERTREHYATGTPALRAAREIAAGKEFRDKGFATWDSPERIVTNVHLLYREYAGKTAPLGMPAKLAIMKRQAELAYEMKGSTPAVMH